jgi:hypothetical protein
MAALLIGVTIIMVPHRADAAEPAEAPRQVWTAAEAEMAQEIADGVPLKDIIDSSVKAGSRIDEVVISAIKVGANPSLVVSISITGGYAAQTVVKAALDAGVPYDIVLNSVKNAGPNKKPTAIDEVVAAAVKFGVDPYLVVHSTISTGYPAQIVIKTALNAGAPLNDVVKAAVDAGAEKRSIYAGAADAGKSPAAVKRALLAASIPLASAVMTPAKKPATTPSDELTITSAPAIFGIGGIVLSQSPAWALPTISADTVPVTVNAFLALAETFSDNARFTSAGTKESDSLTTITPGVRLRLPFRAHVAEAELYGVMNYYKTNKDLNVNDIHIGLSADFKVTDPFTLRIADTFDKGHESLSSSPTGSQEVFRTNVLAASAAYQFTENFKALVDYGMSTWRFDTAKFRDRDENGLTGTVSYKVLSKMWLFMEYGGRNIAYSDKTLDLDSTVSTLQAGLTWDISSRSKGTIKAGLAQKNFTSSAKTDGTVKVGSADVRHDFTSDTTVVLTAERSLKEPNIQGMDYFISTGGYADLTQRFLQKWAVMIRGAAVQDNYFIRTDRSTLGGIGLKHRTKDWLEFAVDYNWRSRHSDDPGYNYTEQSAIIKVSASI